MQKISFSLLYVYGYLFHNMNSRCKFGQVGKNIPGSSVRTAMPNENGFKRCNTCQQINVSSINHCRLSASFLAARIICFTLFCYFCIKIVEIRGVIYFNLYHKLFQGIIRAQLNIETTARGSARDAIGNRFYSVTCDHRQCGSASFRGLPLLFCHDCVAILCVTYTVER